jgi:hypothetical protein
MVSAQVNLFSYNSLLELTFQENGFDAWCFPHAAGNQPINLTVPCMPKPDVIEPFKKVVVNHLPDGRISTEYTKNWAKNNRIALGSSGTAGKSSKRGGVKLGKVTCSVAPKQRRDFVLVSTGQKGTFLVGSRLTVHGGHLAVELAKKLAPKFGQKVVVLERTVLAFTPITATGMGDSRTDLPAALDAVVTSLDGFQEEFHQAVARLLDEHADSNQDA